MFILFLVRLISFHVSCASAKVMLGVLFGGKIYIV